MPRMTPLCVAGRRDATNLTCRSSALSPMAVADKLPAGDKMLYPLRFKPIFKPRIWGGRRLAELYGKPLPPGVDIGESWELSGLPGDESVVADGPLAGATLGDLVRRFGRDLLGTASPVDGQFPLLVKLLDARRNLSVQVHPSAEMVRRRGGACRLKHACWFVIDAEPGACLWLGPNGGVTRERFAAAVSDGSVATLLRCRPVRAGEFYDLPAGTVHALGAGVVVAEVQTPSDTTYRVTDWGRGREVHLERSMECIRFGPADDAAPGAAGEVLLATEHFTVARRTCPAGGSAPLPEGRCCAVMLLEAAGGVEVRHTGADEPAVAARAGDTILLPAALRRPGLRAAGAAAAWLEITLPEP